MADAGFYRGTSSEQDSRFTDKERKLLKQMRFEEALDEKICMDRVNLDVLKPWITAKLNDILGLEDDVVIEYVFSQLEEKSLNPKVMQINLTGFLNARRAREFMGELWSMLIEAQSSEDGIPTSLVAKKMKEIQEKAKNITVSSSNGAAAEVAGSDWKNRYDSLTGGRYGNRESKTIIAESERGRKNDERHKSHRDRENDKSREGGRVKEDDRIERKRADEKQFKDEKLRSHSRSPTRRHFHDERMERKKERFRSPNRSPPRRKFTERKEDSRRRSRSNERRKGEEFCETISINRCHGREAKKKKKKHSKKRTSDSDSERVKRRKKHKKRRSAKSTTVRALIKKFQWFPDSNVPDLMIILF
ncbi:Serine/arginine repetitive matrix protein 1 [Dirofilaria immitis]|nr:Serine/arginine repetitive matrix protein 1 [Dirofilaria immitis]